MDTKVGPILMGIAYLAVVVFIMIFCAHQAKDFDEFAKYWGLFGTLVGVATVRYRASSSSPRQTRRRISQTSSRPRPRSTRAQRTRIVSRPCEGPTQTCSSSAEARSGRVRRLRRALRVGRAGEQLH